MVVTIVTTFGALLSMCFGTSILYCYGVSTRLNSELQFFSVKGRKENQSLVTVIVDNIPATKDQSWLEFSLNMV